MGCKCRLHSTLLCSCILLLLAPCGRCCWHAPSKEGYFFTYDQQRRCKFADSCIGKLNYNQNWVRNKIVNTGLQSFYTPSLLSVSYSSLHIFLSLSLLKPESPVSQPPLFKHIFSLLLSPYRPTADPRHHAHPPTALHQDKRLVSNVVLILTSCKLTFEAPCEDIDVIGIERPCAWRASFRYSRVSESDRYTFVARYSATFWVWLACLFIWVIRSGELFWRTYLAGLCKWRYRNETENAHIFSRSFFLFATRLQIIVNTSWYDLFSYIRTYI